MNVYDNFTEVFNSVNKLKTLEQTDLSSLVSEFEKFSGQTISKEIVDKFKMNGLSHEDFFTSDFLNRYGLKNLLQIMTPSV